MRATGEMMVGAWCLSAYLYNTSGNRFALDMHGDDAHPAYLEEYANLFAENPARALAKLDDAHFRSLMEIAVARHGSAARETLVVWPC